MPLTDRDYDLLSLYIDDELTPPERRAVELRLKDEPEFRAELAALRQTVALIKAMPEMITPRDLRLSPKIAAEVLAEIAARPVPRVHRPALRLMTNLAAAAASLVLVLAGALSLLSPTLTSPLTMSIAMQLGQVTSEASVVPTEPLGEQPTEKLTDEMLSGIAAPDATPLPYATAGFEANTMMDTPEDAVGTLQESDPGAAAMMQMAAPTGAAGTLFMAEPSPTRTAIGFIPTEGAGGGGDDGAGAAESAPAPMVQMDVPPASPANAGETTARAISPAPTSTAALLGSPTPELDSSLANTPAESQTDLPGAFAREELEQPTVIAGYTAPDNEDSVDVLGDDQAQSRGRAELASSALSSPAAGIAMLIAGFAIGLGLLILRRRQI